MAPNQKHPPGPTMDLANMREQRGASRLLAPMRVATRRGMRHQSGKTIGLMRGNGPFMAAPYDAPPILTQATGLLFQVCREDGPRSSCRSRR